MAEQERLGLFPLGGVALFPGTPLPLRIFEPRYRLMIGECIEGNRPFGVALIKDGFEVGAPAQPYPVGTTARILRTEPQTEGRPFRIETVGERRFRILETDSSGPYLTGTVEYLEDEGLDDLGDLPSQLRPALADYLRFVGALKGDWEQNVDTPEDPLTLSYAAAQAVTHPPMVGQYLLQMSSVRERMERTLPLLRERTGLLKDELTKRTPFKGPRLN